MAEIIPFRRAKRWTHARDYGDPARRHRGRGGGGGAGARWARAARESGPILWAAPLALGVAVFLATAPATGDRDGRYTPPRAEIAGISEAELRKRTWPDTPEALDAQQPDLSLPDAPMVGAGRDRERASFATCGDFASRDACVIDGDTFWYRGEKIRVADINTPEVSRPKCPAEAELGAKATRRFAELLNAGAFTLEPIDRSHDKYGRALFVVTRGGTSLGNALVNEGLAERWQGYRREWC